MRHPLKRKSAAYQEVLRGRAGEIVLADLARFCHANQTVHVEGDTHGTAQLEGRRQVWLRIKGLLRLSEQDIDEMVEHAVSQEGEE